MEIDDGTLHPLTPVGVFTLERLRLNRPPLIARRFHKRQQAEQAQALTSIRNYTRFIETLLFQQAAIVQEQQNFSMC